MRVESVPTDNAKPKPRERALLRSIRRLAFSSAVCGLIIVAILIATAIIERDPTAHGTEGLIILFVLRLCDSCWLVSMLVAFWPSEVAASSRSGGSQTSAPALGPTPQVSQVRVSAWINSSLKRFRQGAGSHFATPNVSRVVRVL